MAENKKNVLGFKKFSDMKSKVEEVDPSSPIVPETNGQPMNPNLPNSKTVLEKPASTKTMMPINSEVSEEKMKKEGVQTIGKVAKFPKNIKASNAYAFLENVKVSKKSIWYIMIEKDNELQMVKYNYKEGVDLSKFVNELKMYYIDKNKGNVAICESISKIAVDGNDKYSMIKNIPPVDIDGKKVITRITEDLIKLLSK